jgi:hypothetical protein
MGIVRLGPGGVHTLGTFTLQKRKGEKNEVHLVLSAMLLSAAAPFIEQQQLDQLENEQWLCKP